MKVCEILEMALSPEMEEQKKKDQAKIKAERDWSRKKRGGSRLTGRGRGTGSPSGVSVAGVRS